MEAILRVRNINVAAFLLMTNLLLSRGSYTTSLYGMSYAY